MDERHAYWLAALIDGEGSIIISRRQGRSRLFACITIAQNVAKRRRYWKLRPMGTAELPYCASLSPCGPAPRWRRTMFADVSPRGRGGAPPPSGGSGGSLPRTGTA